MRLLSPAAHSNTAAVARVMCHFLLASAAVAQEPLAAPPPPSPSPPPPSPKSPSPCPPPPSPLRAVVSDGMRLELRFLGGHGRAPNAHMLLVELGSALGVDEPQERIKVQETHHAPNSPLSYATFDLLPPNNVRMSAEPSVPELAARLTKLLGGMQCESMLDATEVWSSDECLSGRESTKLAVDGKYDTLADGSYPPSWRACAHEGTYEYEQTLRVRLRTPLPPGQPLLLRLVAPENGTDAFKNQVTPLLLGSNRRYEGQRGPLGPAAPCVATADGAVELQDGGVSVAVCSSSATTDSEFLYLTGRGRGRVGKEGAGGLALAEVQACRPNSSSRLYALTADGSFLYPTLTRVDVRAGLQQIGVSTGGDDYQCGELGKPCVKIIRPSVRTQLMPELVARHFDRAGAPPPEANSSIASTAVLAMGLLLLTVSCAFCLERFWRAHRAWQLELERYQLERDEFIYDDDAEYPSAKSVATGITTGP